MTPKQIEAIFYDCGTAIFSAKIHSPNWLDNVATLCVYPRKSSTGRYRQTYACVIWKGDANLATMPLVDCIGGGGTLFARSPAAAIREAIDDLFALHPTKTWALTK